MKRRKGSGAKIVKYVRTLTEGPHAGRKVQVTEIHREGMPVEFLQILIATPQEAGRVA